MSDCRECSGRGTERGCSWCGVVDVAAVVRSDLSDQIEFRTEPIITALKRVEEKLDTLQCVFLPKEPPVGPRQDFTATWEPLHVSENTVRLAEQLTKAAAVAGVPPEEYFESLLRTAAQTANHRPQQHLKTRSTDTLEVSVRVEHCLKKAGIDNIGQLCAHTPKMLRAKGFYAKGVRDVEKLLAGMGLSLEAESK